MRPPAMNMPVDFFALYSELGVEPSCSPESFKRAYRRRVAELHPDRCADAPASEDLLKTINIGYAAALDFFRTHGRLPGATLLPPDAQAQPQPAREAWSPEPGIPVHTPDTRPPRRRRWLGAVLAAAVVLIVLSQLADVDSAGETGTVQAEPPSRTGARPPAQAAPVAPITLSAGTTEQEIRRALGAPTDITDDGHVWHYGPSWIRMVCGQARDWYSSPLKPLGNSTMQPEPGARWDGETPRHCRNRLPGLSSG